MRDSSELKFYSCYGRTSQLMYVYWQLRKFGLPEVFVAKCGSDVRAAIIAAAYHGWQDHGIQITSRSMRVLEFLVEIKKMGYPYLIHETLNKMSESALKSFVGSCGPWNFGAGTARNIREVFPYGKCYDGLVYPTGYDHQACIEALLPDLKV